MAQELYIIDNSNSLKSTISELFSKEKDFKLKKVNTEKIDEALKNIPSLIIINEDEIDENIIEVCKRIRMNEDNSITPIIVVSSNKEKEHRVEVLKECVEHYIKAPVDKEYLYYTIKNVIRLLDTNRRVSPLTGLPGNVQIQTEIKKRLLKKDAFAVMYFDLDNFKAYNDVYGFSNGDEVIKLLARIIVKNIHNIEYGNNFIGHIGGDDFVAVIDKYNYESLCKDIINDFDTKVVKYYTEEDVERGFVEVANRKGIIEEFPIVSLSIAVVEVENGNFTSPLEIGEVSAQVKHMAKEMIGSTYVINRRRTK